MAGACDLVDGTTEDQWSSCSILVNKQEITSEETPTAGVDSELLGPCCMETAPLELPPPVLHDESDDSPASSSSSRVIILTDWFYLKYNIPRLKE